MRVDLIRHGECADSAWLRGRSPSLLTAKGQRQMQAALASVTSVKSVTTGANAHIISSPAERCLAFAQAHFNQLEIVPALQERDFGVWDGLSYAQIEALDADGLARYLDEPFDCTPPKAESFLAYQQRIDQAWLNLIDQALIKNQQHLVVLGHGGPMRLILRELLGMPLPKVFQLHIGYACRVSIEVTATEWGTFSKLLEVVQYDDVSEK